MTSLVIYPITAVILFSVGLLGLVSHPNLLRKIVCLNIMAGGAFLFLISLAYRAGDPAMDPVPQAMVLTGIVVAVSATAFALCLARLIKEKTGHCSFDDNSEQ
ncbi:sodium:proton antiporter [Desulfonatronovibrio magnus]|uniref:sodium:proton antiporter n=1 Tax=Desulfonatronovibrio magnus TaxID=698827 RepID=UPI0005EB1B67|nr:cation:proton antiporter subunit C [Desulfonatronovibrio magnus]